MSLCTELVQNFHSETLSSNQKTAVLSALFGKNDWNETVFDTVKAHFFGFLDTFKPLAFPKGFGFDAFELEDILTFFITETQFEFSLKKEKQKHILYGHIHGEARQQLFNGLPSELKRQCFLKKCEALNLFPVLDVLPSEILDCWDIGIGHSVYAVKTSQKTFVIKREELPNQSLFCLLLAGLGWPSFDSKHRDKWEISDYLGSTSLCDVLQAQPALRQDIEDQLAKHAALGDVLGRGDRHYDNYMMTEKGLVPIDISFLFWEGNEDWDYKYISGGLYEYNVLRRYSGTELDEKKTRFFKIYKETLLELKSAQSLLEQHITTFLGRFHLETQDKLFFIRQRLNHLETYFESQKWLYEKGFKTMEKRERLKQKLHTWKLDNLDMCNQTPLLKMYSLTDTNRPSCFFLLEEFPELTHQLSVLNVS